MSFTAKLIDVIVTLGTGSFGESGANTVNLTGFGVSASIVKIGSPGMDSAQIMIYGLSRSLMNQLSQLALDAFAIRRNIVTVMAGDAESGKALVFSGLITYAWPDMTSAPNVSFVIEAVTGLLGQIKPVAPISFPDSTDVSDIMQALANQMGLAFEGNNVHVFLSSPYYFGTAREQAIRAADDADIYVYFENDTVPQTPQSPGSQGILSISYKDEGRETFVPLIAPPPLGGMNGYPTYAGPGTIIVKTLFNPNLRLLGRAQIQGSVIQQANGLWRILKLSHRLETGFPNAREWFSEFTGFSITIPS